MTEPTHISDLKAVRDALVEARRNAARSSVQYAENNQGEKVSISNGAKLRELQEQIEAVDRSIADEEKIRGPITSTKPLGI